MAHSYETVIGLEIHVQLSTASKAFCGDSTRFGAAPNTQVSAISLGHPGTLPRLNEQQVAYAIRLGLALGSDIQRYNTFDRKNYFYADLPKGYQITQDARPVCVGGRLPIRVGDETRYVRIHHIHMEEDAGKSMHDSDDPFSYIDLNRAGVPLLEVVTEPDLRSAEEVDACMSAMRQLVQYLGISDGNMQEGSMRCDCNVSIRPMGSQQLGQRCEIKNLNSMRYARRAIAYEVNRQIELVESGGQVEQETLNFDPVTGVTSPLRSKEDAHDYRYFPEPDLLPVNVSEEQLAALAASQPKLPWVWLDELQTTNGLSTYDAELLTSTRTLAEFFEAMTTHTDDYKAIANLLINKVAPWCKEQGLEPADFPVAPGALAAFLQLIKDGQVSNSIAYQELFPRLLEQPTVAPAALAKAHNLIQETDTDWLAQLADEVIAAFPDKAAAYRKGKKGLIGFFMGETMKRSQGKAEPKQMNELLRERLEG
ncbi:MAG: Asp-tRNA(Asn)/Glu-tRNA(Gln) amidotransferase subunit GatB [Lewinella sp.]|nr:Asp-tRNA(Asn)/Glu-tRNA(Gln) amidotransferase subunit GatB [Lewinella sp.]